MAENKKDLFGGFDALSLSSMLFNGDGSDKTEVEEKVDESEKELEDLDLDKIKKDLDTDTDKKPEKVSKTKTPKEPEVIEEEEEEKPDDEEDPEFSQYESEASSFFAKDLTEKLGIELPEDSKIESMEDVVGQLIYIVKENSKPSFANPDIDKLNQFVENGGEIKEYFNTVFSGSLNLDKIDLKKDSDQKLIIREHMVNQGYKEDRIKRALDRFEEAGVLEDQAEDAFDLVKEYNEKQAKKLLAEQEKFALEEQNAKQEFVNSVYNNVQQSKEILGVPVSELDKKLLIDYILKPDKNGLTEMQKDYNDPQKRVTNLIETAYFKKFQDKISSGKQRQGEKKAYEEIREKLKAGKGKRSAGGNTNFNEASPTDNLLKISSLLNNN